VSARLPTPCLFVEDPGFLASVQDAGRPGLGGLGIAAGGAADPESLEVANALLGNPAGAAVLELTLAGARLRALRTVTLALSGADLGARVAGSNEAAPAGETVTLRGGDVLVLHGPPAATLAGCRAYIAIPGGVAVPEALGSRSTALGAGFGGLDGRALRAGDVIEAAGATALQRDPARWAGPAVAPLGQPIRVLPGPRAGEAFEALVARGWTVSPASDRIGLRLAGVPLPAAPGAGSIASHGVLPGAVQLPPDGLPIVLLVDAQPTGGYPVVAVVAAVDRPRLGQLAPGMPVRLEPVDEAAARRLAAARRQSVAEALAQLRDARAWDELWRTAGA
jgi:antagonist of KipI